MKKIVFLIVVLLIGGFFVRNLIKKSSEKSDTPQVSQNSEKQVLGKSENAESIVFVPYWTIGSGKLETPEDELLYFGVSADRNGIKTDDPGYEKIQDFMNVSDSGKKRLLTVRMLDQEENSEILRNPALQQKIISESIDLARENGFDGIVLDLESSAVSFDSVVKRISDFNTQFAKQAHADNLLFYTAIYGDTYYRARPYDLKTIGHSADKVLIMAYDFHKARGNPGPNFPLSGKQNYGYDFKTLISDYSKDVPIQKLIPVFGMFGYDWEVDEKGNAISNGISSSTNSINAKFINSCSQKDCKWVRNPEASETQVTYTDSEDQKHEIWFEDEESVKRKREFLKEKGIHSYGYWAYSYY